MQISLLYIIAAAAAVQAANVVKENVVYSAKGASDVVGNGFGCAHSKLPSFFRISTSKKPLANESSFLKVTPSGAGSQLGCVKHVFEDGFTVGVTE